MVNKSEDSEPFASFAQSFANFAVKKKFHYCLLMTFVFKAILSDPIFCQSEGIPENIINIAEELAADESDPEAVSFYIEQLQDLYDNPVKINSGDETEIYRLFFLSDFQLNALKEYVLTTGNIVSVFELANIPGFNRHSAETILQFLSLEEGSTKQGDESKLRNYLITNLSFNPGEIDTSAPGSPSKILSKYKFSSGRFQGGLTVEKDQGEKFFSDHSPGPDFMSAHFSYKGNGFLRRIILGDFGARFGQGTNINTGIHTAPSLTASGYMAGVEEIKPYTSTDENNFFRGVAAEFALKRLHLKMFFSSVLKDASVEEWGDSTHSFISSFYKAGLHSSPSLLGKKDAVREVSAGFNLSFSFSRITIGTTFSGNRFSLPVVPDKRLPENLFDFSGTENRNFSVYYNSLINRILLYGEWSVNNSHDYSLVQGVSIRPSDRLMLNILYTGYSPGYHSFHSNGPGISISDNNETSLLGNFTYEAAKHLYLSAGCNFSRFPWLRYRCSSPSVSIREEVKLNYTPIDDLSVDLIYKYRSADYNSADEQGIPGATENKIRALKVAFRYIFNKTLTLITRIDLNKLSPSGSAGMMLTQDMKLCLEKLPLTLWMRYSLYKTDDWGSRIYSYENDLMNSFCIPAFEGDGSRSYIMADWEFGKWSELRIKYAVTSASSGKEITGMRDEFKVQYRVWF